MFDLAHILDVLVESYPLFMKGLLITLQLTFVSILIGTGIGLVFALFKISGIKVLNWIANIYIALIRGTPLIVQIFIFYFGLAELGISAFWSAAFGLAMHNGAYIAEIFRGSIQSVDKGQMEAGRSLGMTYGLAMRRIILPQAFKRALPPLGNQFIIGLKDSSLASFIALNELFSIATTQGSRTFDEMTYLIIVGLYYLILVLLFTLLVNLLEKKLSAGE
ncbi:MULTISPECIES: amino acid ABC transporter permease [Fictibacillus]|jgi:polar amino acid transport system permease protein|uniref:amino acid ABC transporter permease n=1 Tax=Fictibacillus TaxID=1329200 RepID=UPI0018CFE90C|nr:MULTISPECIES: amino acid ABC transporter permease [unclassified Fictibacillus]MBH0157971.1 amino acid ABC transporter permease [Fictibacillus sp. 5RED26]MBH0159626.1 amino acid ABC transporter permease [Fictibacillus sp. 26RED30]MBH0163574.1 amino acid ABC transporter permease [Fictibacillus sp. 7GRE50]MBH0175857.1 amino acid ABC transporter permease [Fictibacillus sp. 23RED33]